MKLVCECGNEMEFVVDEKKDANSPENLMENEYFADTDLKKFDIWAEHDEAGIKCKECGKSIWFIT